MDKRYFKILVTKPISNQQIFIILLKARSSENEHFLLQCNLDDTHDVSSRFVPKSPYKRTFICDTVKIIGGNMNALAGRLREFKMERRLCQHFSSAVFVFEENVEVLS